MKNKLFAIWRIIKSEHYLVITAGGGMTSCLPEDLNTLKLMNEFVEKVRTNIK